MNALVLKDVSLLKSAILYIAVFGIIFCAVFNRGRHHVHHLRDAFRLTDLQHILVG